MTHALVAVVQHLSADVLDRVAGALGTASDAEVTLFTRTADPPLLRVAAASTGADALDALSHALTVTARRHVCVLRQRRFNATLPPPPALLLTGASDAVLTPLATAVREARRFSRAPGLARMTRALARRLGVGGESRRNRVGVLSEPHRDLARAGLRLLIFGPDGRPAETIAASRRVAQPVVDASTDHATQVATLGRLFGDTRTVVVARDPRSEIPALARAWATEPGLALPGFHGARELPDGRWRGIRPPGWSDRDGGSITDLAAWQWEETYRGALAALRDGAPGSVITVGASEDPGELFAGLPELEGAALGKLPVTASVGWSDLPPSCRALWDQLSSAARPALAP